MPQSNTETYEIEIYCKLHEAEAEAHETDQRFSHEEVFSELRKFILPYQKK